jgi:hypothetical protein
MAAPPATQVPTISPAEMQILVSRAGLVLNPGQVADLVLAWRQLAGLIASVPRDRPLADDMAVSFRLPPTEPAAPEPRSLRPRPQAVKRAAKPPVTRAVARASAKVKAKAARKAAGRAASKR